MNFSTQETPSKRKTRRLVKEACTVLEQMGKINLLVFTFTHPSKDKIEIECFNQMHAKAADAINRYCRQHLKQPLYCYVWEFQKRGAMHLHYAVHVPENVQYLFTTERLRTIWHRALISINRSNTNFSQHKNGWEEDPFLIHIHVAECKRSIASYFAKTETKISSVDWTGTKRGGRSCGISRPLSQAVEKERLIIEFPAFFSMIDHIFATVKAQLPANWTPLLNPFYKVQIGWKAWMSRTSAALATAKEKLRRIADEEEQKAFALCGNGIVKKVVFRLFADGFCQLIEKDSLK